MVAANIPKQYLNLIGSNCWNMDDLDKCRCQDDDGLEVCANLPAKVLSYVLLDIVTI